MMVPSEVLDRKTEAEAPPTPTLAPPAVSILPANLGCMAKLTAYDNPRYAMNGVRVTVDQENVKAEATDGRVLGIVTSPNDPSPEYLVGLVSLVKTDVAPARTAVVSREVWEEAFKSGPENKAGASVVGLSMTPRAKLNLPDSTGEHTEGDPVLHVVFGQIDGGRSLKIEASGLDGRYPDTHAILQHTLTHPEADCRHLLRRRHSSAPAFCRRAVRGRRKPPSEDHHLLWQ